MIFEQTTLPDAYLITLERVEDERGFFARAYCSEVFARHGLATHWPQCNVSYSARRGTLRGMHLQAPPHEEDKLVRCTSGAIYDVIVDLRPESGAYLRHFGVVLSAENRAMLYAPRGIAHGFVTLTDNTEVFYQMSHPFAPDAQRGYRYDDPAFGIEWPEPARVISERDRNYQNFDRGLA